MMAAVNGILFAVSTSPAASIVFKATVTTALALFAVRLARRGRAAVRHALLAAMFGALLLLPAASLVVPPFRIALPGGPPERSAASPFARAANLPLTATALLGVNAGKVSPPAGLSPSALLLTLWIAGTAIFLLPVILGLWQVRRLRRSALPWGPGQAAVESLMIDAGVHRRVELLLHGSVAGPMTCGLMHPAIVLPPDAQTWEREDLNRAILHELEHVRRGDWVSHCLARAVCAVYWFHPLVWAAWRQLTLEAERCCDDAVLERSEPTAYADQLVGLARRLSKTHARSPLLAMANRADLAARVGAVLDSGQRRGRAGTLRVALACAAAVLALTLSPIRVVAAPQSSDPVTVGRLAARTGLVIEAVTVADSGGNIIEGLSAKDFVITEDGAQENPVIFEFQKLEGAAHATRNSVSSYYILGYYTRNDSLDGKYRTVKISLPANRTATLDYRPGYYADKSFIHFDGTNAQPAGVVDIGHAGLVDDRAGSDIQPPRLVSKVEPEYSDEARKAKFQGVAVIQILVDATGKAVNPKVIKSLGLGLDEKAIAAVTQWKFKPGMKDGKPAAVQMQVEVHFRLL